MPLAMLGLPLYIYLPTFYAQNVGMSMSLVGVILFLARLSDVITDPLVGIYSDRYGKRKPFIVVGSALIIIAFYALIHPPTLGVAWWLLGFSMVVYLGWSIVLVPYLAWSAEITSNYHEKTRLSGAREILTILGAMGALIVPYLYRISEDAAASLEILYFSFAIGLVLMLPLTLLGIKEKPQDKKQSWSLKDFKQLWKTIPFLSKLQSAFILNALANALPATLFLFFVEHILNSPSQTGKLLLLYFVSGIVGLPFWMALSKRIGKRKSWQGSMALASSAFLFVPFLGAGDTLYFAIISGVSGLSLGADMALPASIQTDIIQKIQHSQKNYAGVLFGMWAMLSKFAMALAVGIGFVVLGVVGFEPNAPTPLALGTLTLLYAGAPIVFKVMAFWLMLDYPDTPSLEYI